MIKKAPDVPLNLGWEEWLELPDLGVPAIRAKVDTGAKTSAIHAFLVEPYGRDHKRVRFGLHPLPDRPDIQLYCSADLVDQREVTSSNGETELRYIIKTTLTMGGQSWPIEVSLTNREGMAYRMLLGRSALKENVIIDPTGSCLQGSPNLTEAYKAFDPGKQHERKLRIAILSREAKNYTTNRLVEAAEARGHSVAIINTTRCYMNINSTQPEVHYDGKVLPTFDAVIPRIGASITHYGLAVVRQFEAMGVYPLNSSAAIGRSRDKLYAHQILARAGIGMPVTGFARSPHDTEDLIKTVGGAPLILKLLEGTQGKGVVLAETAKAAESVIDAFRGLQANFLVQEFVAEAGGADVRCLVVGNKVVGAMMRQAAEGEYRSNLHRGGIAKKVRITKAERETAVKAAKTMGLPVAGVDLLRSDAGPKVLEVNSSPGLEGIETALGMDIAEKIIEYLERYCKPSKLSKISKAKKL